MQLPKNPRPIYIIGGGGIVTGAHLPAYEIAGFEVHGIYDINREKAENAAQKFETGRIYDSLDQMVQEASEEVVYDVAVPGGAILEVLEKLPDNASVLIQKPMGNDYKEAQKILDLTRRKNLNAGINFQLRYAPYINKARDMINNGEIGELCDIEVNVNVFTPWNMWDFLFSLPRVEILYHSIHYLDLIRSFYGDPSGIYAKTTKHPNMEALASVRTAMIMDYGEWKRANIVTNHCHQYGMHNQHSYIKLEGTKGAIKIRMGVLMNYPEGEPDIFEYVKLEDDKNSHWKTADIDGTWFPHAFIGSMAQVMLTAEGSISKPDNTVEDCINTMAWVEAAYRSSYQGGFSIHNL